METEVSAKLREERGAAAVEFILVGGLLLAMLFMIIDIGLMLTTNLVLTQAAREGSRRAAIEGGATHGAFERIENQVEAARLSLEQLKVDIKPRRASYGTIINVQVDYRHRFRTPIMRKLAGDPFPLRVEMSARSEYLDARRPEG